MSTFVEDIENVGAEIELIAINASVKAARTGDKGRALGVLAESIQRLSKEAGTMTEAVSHELQSIGESAQRLTQGAQVYTDNTSMQAMIEDLAEVVSGLKTTDAEVSGLFTELNSQAAHLAGEALLLGDSLDFHHLVAEEINNVSTGLEQMVDQATLIVPEKDSSSRADRLKGMLDRYTMEAERLVHESGGQEQQTAAMEPESELWGLEQDANTLDSGDSEENWDNVDLF